MTTGTPHPASAYVFPRSAFSLLLRSLLLGAGLLGALLVAHAAGLRASLSPGDLTSAHSSLERRCDECHQPRQGVANPRCQRCHDPAGASRLGSAAHVLFGSGDPARAAATPDLGCAGCHVDHRGRAHALARVEQAQCEECHFRGLGSHPEFAPLRAATRELPGLRFGHQRHLKELAKETGAGAAPACVRCHEPSPATRDLEPLSFERHCAACHLKDGSLGSVDPVPAADALAPPASSRPGEEFELTRGKVSHPSVGHRDEWILASARRLRLSLEPSLVAAERGALQARLAQLRRRLVLATPLATFGAQQLEARQAALSRELDALAARARESASAPGAVDDLARLEEVVGATQQAGEVGLAREALELARRALALRASAGPSRPLTREEHDARREELLATLGAIEAADASVRPRVEDLRRRLLSLVAGTSGAEQIGRARAQREADLERVRDELRLRGLGVQPPATALTLGEQRVIRDAIAQSERRLAQLGEPTAAAGASDAPERRRESLAALLAPCAKCHVVEGAALAAVVAARPVLFRSVFKHQPHLAESDCARCHPSVAESRAAEELSAPGIERCRECHRPRGATQACQSCHRYHPRLQP